MHGVDTGTIKDELQIAASLRSLQRRSLVIASLFCACAREAGYGDLIFSIRITDWRLPRRFAPRSDGKDNICRVQQRNPAYEKMAIRKINEAERRLIHRQCLAQVAGEVGVVTAGDGHVVRKQLQR